MITFLNAANRILMLIEKPDIDPLAFQIVKREIITEDEVGDMIDKICEGMDGEPIEMYNEDVLVLYTIIELYVRLMLSYTGDEIKEGMKKHQEKYPPPEQYDMEEVFRMEMAAASAFVRSIMEEYEDNPAFIARRDQLQELNEFI